MADIHIQAKKPPLWPWAVGLLVLALVFWASYALLGIGQPEEPLAGVSDPATAGRAVQGVAPRAAPDAVEAYLDNCAPREPEEMRLDHEYTTTCIRQLVGGIEALVQEHNLTGAEVQPQLQQARQGADRLAASGPQAAQHSAMTREAFQAIAQAMNRIQDVYYPQLDAQVAQVESAATTVDPATNLLEQREHVQRFFRQAGDALNAMATASPRTA